uniref:MFS transporter n=1 Tax=candidate division WOR-3 bacterium TaxID=2052148 RepID=A0A7C2P8T7_UNCW3
MRTICLTIILVEKQTAVKLYSLAVIRGLQSASYAISIPFLSIYLYNVRGVPMSLVGTIIGFAAVLGSFLRFYAGRLSDTLPTDTVMKLGLFLRASGFLGFSILILLKANPLLFFFFFLLNSSGASFFMSASDVFVAKNIDEPDRPFAYSVIRVGGNLGFAIGPSIGGFISRYSYAMTFFASFLLQVICVFLIIYLVSSREERKSVNLTKEISFGDVFKNKNFMLFIAGTFVLSLLMGQLISTLSVYAKHKGLDNVQIGYLYSINGFMVVFFQMLIIKVVDYLGYKKGLVLGSLLYSVGYFYFAFSHNFTNFAIGVIVLTTGEMLAMPLLTTITSAMAPDDKRGLYIGFLGFIEGLSWAVAPFIGGVLIDIFLKTPVLIWGTVASFGVISSIIFMKVRFN